MSIYLLQHFRLGSTRRFHVIVINGKAMVQTKSGLVKYYVGNGFQFNGCAKPDFVIAHLCTSPDCNRAVTTQLV